MSLERIEPRKSDLWAELVYDHDEPIPPELLDGTNLTKVEVSDQCEGHLRMVLSGWPQNVGDYFFWYGPRLSLLGWSPCDSKHKKLVAKLGKLLQHTDTGTISGDKGRDGKTLAVVVIKKEDPAYKRNCLIFIEKRSISSV
jgi:hypothetical protein